MPPSIFHADMIQWNKERRALIKFIKQVIDVAQKNTTPAGVAAASNPKENFDYDDPEKIGKIIDILRRCSLPSNSSGSMLRSNGIAFFPTFSLFRHSCVSNAKFFVFPGNNLAIQAQRPISAGEEITISLVHTLEPTWKRRAKLYR